MCELNGVQHIYFLTEFHYLNLITGGTGRGVEVVAHACGYLDLHLSSYLECHEPYHHGPGAIEDSCQGRYTKGSGQRAPADGAAQDQGQPGQGCNGADEGLDVQHGKAAAAGGGRSGQGGLQ